MSNTENRRSFNIYCDESCHLENDQQKPMLLGCIWAPEEKSRYYSTCLKRLKEEYGVRGELKWTKVSQKNLDFYLTLINWFFMEDELCFRALIVPNKKQLRHQDFNQIHDDFYYKMYFWLLNKIINPDCVYRIYLDVKDTRSRFKVRKLRECLCFDKYDFSGEMITQLRSLRSHDAQLMQLADFLLGAVSYRHRGLSTNNAKMLVAKRFEALHGKKLVESTPLSAHKVNLFVWQPRGAR
jgi:hypothetical protein